MPSLLLLTGTRLLVSSAASSHHLFDAVHPDTEPLASFTGHSNGSFYIKASFSGDGSHILSGSSDHRAYIWAVSIFSTRPSSLPGLMQPFSQAFVAFLQTLYRVGLCINTSIFSSMREGKRSGLFCRQEVPEKASAFVIIGRQARTGAHSAGERSGRGYGRRLVPYGPRPGGDLPRQRQRQRVGLR